MELNTEDTESTEDCFAMDFVSQRFTEIAQRYTEGCIAKLRKGFAKFHRDFYTQDFLPLRGRQMGSFSQRITEVAQRKCLTKIFLDFETGFFIPSSSHNMGNDISVVGEGAFLRTTCKTSEIAVGMKRQFCQGFCVAK